MHSITVTPEAPEFAAIERLSSSQYEIDGEYFDNLLWQYSYGDNKPGSPVLYTAVLNVESASGSLRVTISDTESDALLVRVWDSVEEFEKDTDAEQEAAGKYAESIIGK